MVDPYLAFENIVSKISDSQLFSKNFPFENYYAYGISSCSMDVTG